MNQNCSGEHEEVITEYDVLDIDLKAVASSLQRKDDEGKHSTCEQHAVG